MAPKPILVKQQQETRKSIVLLPDRVISRPDNIEGCEQTEIAAQISIPHESGWGWVVVAASFFSIMILDGIAYTFGSLLSDLANDINTPEELVVLINSIAVALYLMFGPIVSAFINRFGFRACIMTGSVICSLSLLISYFGSGFGILCAFYGVTAGMGFSLINMSSSLVVGFYFERLRSVALAITTCGSSIGVMSMFPMNSFLVKLAGWRSLTLFHSGLFGLIFFFGMAYRPLLSVTVVKTTDDPTRTVAYLPTLSAASVRRIQSKSMKRESKPPVASPTEKLFSAVSNMHFPTAAAVVRDDDMEVATTSNEPGTSAPSPTSRITLKAVSPSSGISPLQLKQVKSIMSTQQQDKSKKHLEVTLEVDSSKSTKRKRSCCAKLCNWESHVQESRPMYRDDVFYEGKIEKLPEYQKSMMDVKKDAKTGLEYQLAVSRAATAHDLRERRGVFTTAVRRVLATMMDPKLLKKCSFICFCTSSFFTYLGFLVPYVFVKDRNASAGMNPDHCTWLVSAIGLANACGRLVLGGLASKLDPLKMFSFSCLMAGVATMCSNISYNVYYQYSYCAVFGFFIASVACLRSIIIVELYGLDRLTNATGMILLFQGLGSLVSTPLAGVLKHQFGYFISFLTAGIFISIGGLMIIPVRSLSVRENKAVANANATNKAVPTTKAQNKVVQTPQVRNNIAPSTDTGPTTTAPWSDKAETISNTNANDNPV